MKKMMLSFTAMVLLLSSLILSGCCLGEDNSRWENEYKACGRTIKVDVDVFAPEKENIPFIAIAPMNELPADEISEYQEFINALDMNVKNDLICRMNKVAIYYSDHIHHPDLSDAEKVTTPYRILQRYDRNTAYAEDNHLTIQEAEDITNQSIQSVLPSTSFRVKDVIVNDRAKYRNTDERLVEKGHYEMYCMQEMNGIPIAGSVHNAYKYDRTKYDRVVGSYGTAYVLVTDRSNFEGTFTLWSKTAELGAEDHLISFDEVKSKVENMIMSGNIRNVYHIYLGYAQYDLPENSQYEYVLAPAWIVWVDYMDSPEEEIDQEAVNGTGAYMEWNYYKPIIINAITGEETNPLDERDDRMLLPASCMEWVDGY